MVLCVSIAELSQQFKTGRRIETEGAQAGYRGAAP
jgi:hypothetical protein